MKYHSKRVVGIIFFSLLIVLLFCIMLSDNTFQSREQDDSVGRIIKSFQQQQYGESIQNSKQSLLEMEKDTSVQFDEAVYIGIANLLAEAYIANGNYGSADSLLSHAIDFLSDSNDKTGIFILYLTKGTLFFNLADYYRAESNISEALSLTDVQSIGSEYYAVVLSMLSTCYRSLNMLDESKSKIDEAISYIDETTFDARNTVSIYQKAVAIYYDLGFFDTAVKYARKTYALSKEDDQNILGFFNSAMDLAIINANMGNYQEALSILHNVEKKELVDTQRARLYQNMYQDYYYLNKERETVKYVKRCSYLITQNILNYFYHNISLNNL